MGLLDYTIATFIADSEASQRYNAIWGNKVENRLQLLSRAVIPLDNSNISCQIDGSGTPLFPDNIAGRVDFQDTWETTNSWSAYAGALAVSNGTLITTLTGAGGGPARSISVVSGQMIIVRIKSTKSGTMMMRGTVGGTPNTTLDTSNIKAGVYTIMVATLDSPLSYLYFYSAEAVSGDQFTIDTIYIGTGFFDSPVYDNACCNRFTNYGVLPIRGPRGCGLLFNGAQWLVADNPVISSAGQISFRIKTGTDITSCHYLLSNWLYANKTGFGCYIESGKLNYVVGIGTANVFGFITISASTKYVISMKLTNTSLSVFVSEDLVITTPLSAPMALPTINLTIGKHGSEASAYFNGILYDFWFDGRVWGDADLIRYVNGEDFIDCQQKSISQVPHAIKTCDSKGNIRQPGLPVFANNTAALAGGLTAGEQYRTATGVLMVVF